MYIPVYTHAYVRLFHCQVKTPRSALKTKRTMTGVKLVKAEKRERLLMTGKTLFGQLYIPWAALLVAADPLKQQMSWSSGFAVKPEPWNKISYLKNGKSLKYMYVPFLSILNINWFRIQQ